MTHKPLADSDSYEILKFSDTRLQKLWSVKDEMAELIASGVPLPIILRSFGLDLGELQMMRIRGEMPKEAALLFDSLMRMHVQKGADLIRRVIEIGEEKNDWHAMAFVLKNFYFPPEQK